jgi:hypothetical protein
LIVPLPGQLFLVSEQRYGAEHDDVQACDDSGSAVARCHIRLVDLLEPNQRDPGIEGICANVSDLCVTSSTSELTLKRIHRGGSERSLLGVVGDELSHPCHRQWHHAPSDG